MTQPIKPGDIFSVPAAMAHGVNHFLLLEDDKVVFLDGMILTTMKFSQCKDKATRIGKLSEMLRLPDEEKDQTISGNNH